jgi:UDP-N-acetylmuramate--alanine ligase
MSAIARYFNSMGLQVAGYDRTPSELCAQLVSEGIFITYKDHVESIPPEFLAGGESTLFIYTPAIPRDHVQWNYLKENEYKVYKRSEVLAGIGRGNFCIAVAGTHGKTTTSTLLAHIFNHCNCNFTAFLGGVSANYGTNFLHREDGRDMVPGRRIMIMEADEFDRSFHRLSPAVAVITGTEPDHLDIYGDAASFQEAFEVFANKITPGGTLVMREGLGIQTHARTISYGVETPSAAVATNLRDEQGDLYFDYKYSGDIPGIRAGLPGRHNVENAVAAITVSLEMGLDTACVKEGVGSFRGARRRFEYIVRTQQYVVIDDYAHHPGELQAFIGAVRDLYPGRKLTGIFQPHLFSRTRDFEEGFAQSLSMLDSCLLMDIYPAREKPIPGVTSENLLKRITTKDKRLLDVPGILEKLRAEKPELLLIMGAGDIDRIVPLVREVYDGV